MFNETVIRTPPQYDRILARSEELRFLMNSDVLTGSLLRVLARTKPDGSFLELGTGCGLGTCWLLDGMGVGSSSPSTTDARVQAIAREELGSDPRLTLTLGDGGEFLDKCDPQFELIYADAWPRKYTHLDHVLAKLKPGSIYVIDDMLPQPNWPADHPLKVAALLAALDAAEGLDVAKLSWSTGVVIGVKRQ